MTPSSTGVQGHESELWNSLSGVGFALGRRRHLRHDLRKADADLELALGRWNNLSSRGQGEGKGERQTQI